MDSIQFWARLFVVYMLEYCGCELSISAANKPETIGYILSKLGYSA